MAFKMKNSGGAFKMMGSSPMKETGDVAYGGTKTWEQGQKDSYKRPE